jgi:hypothetical protein
MWRAPSALWRADREGDDEEDHEQPDNENQRAKIAWLRDLHDATPCSIDPRADRRQHRRRPSSPRCTTEARRIKKSHSKGQVAPNRTVISAEPACGASVVRGLRRKRARTPSHPSATGSCGRWTRSPGPPAGSTATLAVARRPIVPSPQARDVGWFSCRRPGPPARLAEARGSTESPSRPSRPSGPTREGDFCELAWP